MATRPTKDWPVDDNGNALGTASNALVVSGGGGGGDASAANQTALNTLTGAVTETAPASDTASSGLNGRLQRIAQRITTLLAVFPTTIDTNSGNKSASTLRVVLATDQPALTNAQPVTPAATEAHLGQTGGAIVRVTGTFTRPADTTAYAANDVVSNSTSSTTLVTLSSAARVNAGTGYIVGCRVATNKKSITPRIRVHINNANNPTVAADNVAAKTVYADISKRIGSFDLAAMSTSADTTNSDMSAATDWSLRIPFKAAAADTALYVWLETLDAFTPASGDGWTVELMIDQN